VRGKNGRVLRSPVRAFVGIDTGRSSEEAADPAPPHVTLRFLGEIDPTGLDRVLAALPAAVSTVAPFDLGLGDVGAFPSPDRPRVVWRGVREGSEEVRRLARQVSEALAAAGWPPEPGEFVPHVTLFRVRSARDRRRAADLLEGRTTLPPVPVVRVHTVALKESRLGPSGAEHRVLREFPLGVAAAV
jgi:RNA 2',3'-cyclic 3'-phosphodiesterase